MRRTVIPLVLLLAATLPASAIAAVPSNDTRAGAIALSRAYAPASYSVSVPPVGPPTNGGWTEATETDDAVVAAPTCLAFPPYHTMWYSLEVTEASVLSVTLTSTDVIRYQPVVQIAGPLGEVACGLGGSDGQTDPTASASTFVTPGTYYVRIGSAQSDVAGTAESPTLKLSETLRDVTPPEIRVSVSGRSRIVGPGKPYRFDASSSKDHGSDIDPATARWTFPDGAALPVVVQGSTLPDPLIITHAWKSAGVHQVTLELADKSGNVNSYSFSVLVHSFIPPKVALRVFVPVPGAHRLRVVLTHDMPVAVRLVVMQNGRVLRVVKRKVVVKGRRTGLSIPLKKGVGKVGFVSVSGVASDLSDPPNTVPLLSCSVDPVNGGGVCG